MFRCLIFIILLTSLAYASQPTFVSNISVPRQLIPRCRLFDKNCFERQYPLFLNLLNNRLSKAKENIVYSDFSDLLDLYIAVSRDKALSSKRRFKYRDSEVREENSYSLFKTFGSILIYAQSTSDASDVVSSADLGKFYRLRILPPSSEADPLALNKKYLFPRLKVTSSEVLYSAPLISRSIKTIVINNYWTDSANVDLSYALYIKSQPGFFVSFLLYGEKNHSYCPKGDLSSCLFFPISAYIVTEDNIRILEFDYSSNPRVKSIKFSNTTDYWKFKKKYCLKCHSSRFVSSFTAGQLEK